ncbi:uncharacterized protein [Euphorbia lathyris]|uniref:uncharacterized protein isoform X16 n=1 Tax=Euphorbia lathyris TaxID=212925 RepID=UPI003313E1BA
MISSFQMILEDGSIHLDGEELFTFKELIKRTMGSINSNAKVVDITVEDFASTRIQTAFRDYERVSPKIGFSNFEALDWEIHERSSKCFLGI